MVGILTKDLRRMAGILTERLEKDGSCRGILTERLEKDG